MHGESGYGLWTLVILNSAIFVVFAFSFTKPKSAKDWRSLGAFSAFILALFTEMYGFPLTIYFLSGWLSEKFPGLNIFSHENGHLWAAFLHSDINPHFHPIHIIANVLIVVGFILLATAWKALHKAQIHHFLATEGIYAKIRHPQYVGFVLIMLGFLVMWPTLLTLFMFPILVMMYHHLGKKEEEQMIKDFGEIYIKYKKRVPAYIPNWISLFGNQEEAEI